VAIWISAQPLTFNTRTCPKKCHQCLNCTVECVPCAESSSQQSANYVH
jgi:hypothetical protein